MKKLSKRISARCSENEYLEFEKKRKKAGMSKAEFTRKMIFSSTIKETDKEYQRRVLFLMNNISNNINQIAHHANIQKSIDLEVLERLSKLQSYVKSIVKAA